METWKPKKEEADAEQCYEMFEQMNSNETIDKLLLQVWESQLDLKSLERTRRSDEKLKVHFENKSPATKIKLGSLEEAFPIEDDQFAGRFHGNIVGFLTHETASKELISYFAFLGRSENTDDVDYSFLETLLSLADINSKDVHGQTVMHEVAREWNTDLASYLKIKGINIDNEDNWGRTPLFVAVASNHKDMVSWLIDNGADLNHRTIGERQTPIHFAAKYDSIEAFSILLEKGANAIDKDGQDRDPFFLAAQDGNIRICKYLLDLDVPTACYARSGEATIDHIVENLPDELAAKALDQFICVDKSTGNVKLYLSCLGKRRWRLLTKRHESFPVLTGVTPPTPLEIITRRGILKLANHPVMLTLIKLKYEVIGKRFIQLNITLYLLFTFLWTCAACIKIPIPNLEHRSTVYKEYAAEMNVILGVTLVAQAITFVFIYKLIREYTTLRTLIGSEKNRLLDRYNSSKKYCHPRWTMDKLMLRKTKDKAKHMRTRFWFNGWTIIEALSLLMASIYAIITIVWYIDMEMTNDFIVPELRMYYSSIFVIVIWIRLNRAFRSHRLFGPFVAMLSECSACSMKVGLLYFEFFIPLSVTCWVLFGGEKHTEKISHIEGVSDEYEKLNDLLYQLYLLSFGGDYDFLTLKAINPSAAPVFVGLYFLLLTIITINIYIALLSETAQRVIATAVERADLEESDSCGKVERTFPLKRSNFEVYLDEQCSPLQMQMSELCPPSMKPLINTRRVILDATVTLRSISELVYDIVKEQKLSKNDLQCIKEKFQIFRAKYREDDVKSIKKKISSIMAYQLHPIIKVAKKTDDGITKYLNKVKDMYHYN